MRILAALCVGACCALLAGALGGTLPARRPRGQRLGRHQVGAQVWLQQAGVLVTPQQFVLASAFAGAAALLALSALTRSVFVAAVPALAVALLPRAFFGRRRRTRSRAVHAVWPDGLRDLLASIAAGRSLTQAVTTLSTTGPAPLRDAFARFPELARVLGTGPALEVVKEELADPTSDRIIEVLILAHERGGPIVRSILSDLVESTTRDLRLLDELETEGLEMRINARTVVVLPWIVLVALTARPGPFREFYRSSGGVFTIGGAAALSLLGVVVLGHLGREPVETRVVPPRGSAA
ncbi:MAG: type II secretion system F family protein [Actinomycetota bacterium]